MLAYVWKDRDRFGRFKAWVSWEAHRRIEPTLGIRLITIERFLKAIVFLFTGVALIVAGPHRMRELLDWVQDQTLVSPDGSWWRGALASLLKRFGKLTDLKLYAIALGAIGYGILESIEGVGLILRRRWAEYLVLIATAVFLPAEVTELTRGPSVLKAVTFGLNLIIVAYLVWRKRLFLESPATERATVSH